MIVLYFSMKKLIVIILAFLHLSASAGVTMHMHYCMGKLAGWGVDSKVSTQCGKCGMEKSKKNACCKDELKFVKNTNDQKAAESVFQLMQLASVTLPASVFEITSINLPSVTEANPISHGPPLKGDLAVYIRNCVFLI